MTDDYLSTLPDQRLLDELVRRGVLTSQESIIIEWPRSNPIHRICPKDGTWEAHDPGELCESCTITTPPTHITYSGNIPIEREES